MGKKICIAVGIAAVAITTLIVHALLTKRKKKMNSVEFGSKNASGPIDPFVTLQSPKIKYFLKMIEKEVLTHDTRRFRFELPSPNHVLGLAVGQHVYLSATVNGQMVVRPYTPVTSDANEGYFDLVVKIYFKNVHPEFPGGGKLTQYLDGLGVGQSIDVRGPAGALEYLGKGWFLNRFDRMRPPIEHGVKDVGMIAGGTGITPMLQLLRHVIGCQEDETRLWLIFANRQEEDIILRRELEEIAAIHPEHFRMWLTLSHPPERGWTYGRGRIDCQMVAQHIPKPSEDLLVLMCGSEAMVKTCIPLLDSLGHKRYCAY